MSRETDMLLPPARGAPARRAPSGTPAFFSAVFAGIMAIAGFARAGPVPSGIALPSDWRIQGHDRRARLAMEPDDGATILVPLAAGVAPDAPVHAFDARGRPLPARMLAGDPGGRRIAWIRTSPANMNTTDDAGFVSLYYGGGGTEVAPPDDALHDPKPWRVTVFAVTGVGMPDTWERMEFMRGNVRGPESRFFLETPQTLGRERIGGRRGRRALLEAQTHLKLPEAGRYRFAFDGRHPGYVLINGRPVCQWTGEGGSDGWVEGDAIELDGGVHRLTVLNYYTDANEHPLRIGLRAGDAIAPRPIPAEYLLAAVAREPLVTEVAGRRVHPGFRYSVEPAYRVRGAAPVFIPVVFEQNAVDWHAGANDLIYSWEFGDGTAATGARVRHVYTNAGAPLVRLLIAEAAGESVLADFERRIEAAPLRLREHRIEIAPANLPFTVYSDDALEPVLRVDGDFGGRSLEIGGKILHADGRRRITDSRIIPRAAETVAIPLTDRVAAGRIREIAWKISHASAGLFEGRITVTPARAASAPARVANDLVLDRDGNVMVWVASRAPRPAEVFVRAGSPLASPIWLSDLPFPYGGTGPAEGMDRSMRRWSEAPDAAGPLVKILDLIDVLNERPDALMLNFGFKDFVQGTDPDAFECQAAALTEWLLARGTLVLFWATPPPLARPPEAIRPFALAIRRVADARGIPVADQYSLFMGAGGGAGWTKRPPVTGLTAAGMEALRALVMETVCGRVSNPRASGGGPTGTDRGVRGWRFRAGD